MNLDFVLFWSQYCTTNFDYFATQFVLGMCYKTIYDLFGSNQPANEFNIESEFACQKKDKQMNERRLRIAKYHSIRKCPSIQDAAIFVQSFLII